MFIKALRAFSTSGRLVIVYNLYRIGDAPQNVSHFSLSVTTLLLQELLKTEETEMGTRNNVTSGTEVCGWKKLYSSVIRFKIRFPATLIESYEQTQS